MWQASNQGTGEGFFPYAAVGGEGGDAGEATGDAPDGGPLSTPKANRLVIVVDDEPSILDGLSLLLGGWGYEVVSALSIADLNQRLPAVTKTPGLVLADHFLPQGGTGIQVVQLVRDRFGAPVPAIILTGDTTAERQAEATALGCGLLHKPVQVAPLREAVDAAMRGEMPL